MTNLAINQASDVLSSKDDDAQHKVGDLIGVLKDATASSVQYSAGDLSQWLTLPLVLIADVSYLGSVAAQEGNNTTQLPLFSIRLETPRTQSEKFFFDLVMPPFFAATQTLRVAVIEGSSCESENIGPLHYRRDAKQSRPAHSGLPVAFGVA